MSPWERYEQPVLVLYPFEFRPDVHSLRLWCITLKVMVAHCNCTIRGPPIIGDKAWWKFPKIWPICLDINSMFWPNMFGPNLAFGEFSNFFQMPHQASKKCVQISQKKKFFTYFTKCYVWKNHSPPILSASAVPLRPFLRTATIALTAINISWNFPCSSLKIWKCLSLRVNVQLSWPSVFLIPFLIEMIFWYVNENGILSSLSHMLNKLLDSDL